jgi:hypothetical protein
MGGDILEETSREFKRGAARRGAERRAGRRTEKVGHVLIDMLSNG